MFPIRTFFLILVIVGLASCKSEINKTATSNTSDKKEVTVEPSKDTTEPNDERLTWQKPELVISKLGNIQNKTIADLGAGIGYFAFKLLPKCKKVIAIDIDPESVQILQGFQESLSPELVDKFDVRLAASSDPNLQTEEVDVIFIVNTITYISGRINYLTKLKEYLKPGGQIYIVDFKSKRLPAFTAAPSVSERIYMHVLEDNLVEAGFEDVNTDDTTLDYQYIMTAYK